MGKFVSYGVGGASEDDVRFQDTWLRLFQERDPRGKFVMKMIRKADQGNKSWPRAGAHLLIPGFPGPARPGHALHGRCACSSDFKCSSNNMHVHIKRVTAGHSHVSMTICFFPIV